MSSESIKEKITLAKELVSDLEDQLKIEAFKIILTRLLDGIYSTTTRNQQIQDIGSINSSDGTNSNNPIEKLAELCNVAEEQMKNVLDYEGDKFIILKNIEGSSVADKQINASLCILTAWAKGMDQSWLKSFKLGDSLRELSIDTNHLGNNLTKTEYFSLKGKRKAAQYHITTQGWQKGLELLKSMIGE